MLRQENEILTGQNLGGFAPSPHATTTQTGSAGNVVKSVIRIRSGETAYTQNDTEKS